MVADPQTTAALLCDEVKAIAAKSLPDAAKHVLTNAAKLAEIRRSSRVAFLSLCIDLVEACGRKLTKVDLAAAVAAADGDGREESDQSEPERGLTVADGISAYPHVMLRSDVKRELGKHGVAVDAVGRLRDSTSRKLIPGMTLAKLAKRIWYDLAEFGKAKRDDVRAILEVQAEELREKAFRERVAALCGKPATAEGVAALRDWVLAVMPVRPTEKEEADAWDRAFAVAQGVMAHFIWLVKRSALGLPRERDVMPILFSPIQGGGKTTAVERLVSPIEDLTDCIAVETLTDDRKRPDLGRFLVGRWDEMGGAGRKEAELIKSTITGQTFSYRPMGTNDNAVVPRLISFIGTSNKPISTMVRDTTGNRRFYEILTRDQLDHATINAIDYATLWTAVSEHDAAPINAVLKDMQDSQAESIYRDSVTLWLEVEGWVSTTAFGSGDGGVDRNIDAYHADGEAAEDVRARYLNYCRDNGEDSLSGPNFYERLKEEGFRKVKMRCGKKRYYVYRRPAKWDPDRRDAWDPTEEVHGPADEGLGSKAGVSPDRYF